MNSRSVDAVVTTIKADKRQCRTSSYSLLYPAGFTPTMGAFVHDLMTSKLRGRYQVDRVVLPQVYEINTSNWFVGGKGRGVCTGGVRDGATIFVERTSGNVKLMALVKDSLLNHEEHEVTANFTSPWLMPWYCGSHQHSTAIRVYVRRTGDGGGLDGENKFDVWENKFDVCASESGTKQESNEEKPTKPSLTPVNTPVKGLSKSKTIHLKVVYRPSPEDPILSEWIEVPPSLSINQLKFRVRRKLQMIASDSIEIEETSPALPPITRLHKRRFDVWQSPPLTRTQKQKSCFEDAGDNQECTIYTPYHTQTPSKKQRRQRSAKTEPEGEFFFTPQSKVKEENGATLVQVEKMQTFLRRMNLIECFEEFASQKNESQQQLAVAEACTSLSCLAKSDT